MSGFELLDQADQSDMTPETNKKLEKLFFWCNTMLGGTSIEVHLEDADFWIAFDTALGKYRSLSSRSTYDTYGFLQLRANHTTYVLNEKIDNVIKIMRGRGLFGGLGTGTSGFESFGAATAHILLTGGMNPNAATVNLASYDFMLQYQETLERLFARAIHFTFREETHTLQITQIPKTDEIVMIRCSVLKSINECLNDHWAYNWLRDYTLAICRTILGEKYSLFATLPGSQGGSVIKGEQLKQKGAEDMANLEQSILDFADSSRIPMIIRG